jgi:hypothetical protein
MQGGDLGSNGPRQIKAEATDGWKIAGKRRCIMLTLKNIRTAISIGLVMLLIVGTAIAKNERVAQRQAAVAQQRQARAAQRQANNQARSQAAAQRREAQQAKVAQIQANNQARRQAAAERVEAQQANAAQRRVENQARVEAVRQVRVERREQTAQNRQVKVEQRAENRPQQQENRQARVERQAEVREQIIDNQAEVLTARNENRQRPTLDVKRDVDVKRIVGPSGTKVIKESNIQRTITRRGGGTTTTNINRTLVRNIGDRFDRPQVVRLHNYPGHRDRDGRGTGVLRRYPGRRPNSIFRHIVWRNYGYPVYYRHGPDLFVHYVRPIYHRKYVFVSFGSYWPAYYSSLRYYWYGLHPYSWYGCYPTAYGTSSDTYNYYTYNTYNYDSGSLQDYTASEYSGPLEGVDETTFEDVRQKLEQQSQQQPDEETLTDKFFEDGVTAFEQEDYGTAAKAFADAIALEPNDLILPFAYVQALFASEQYSRAADILRLALEQMPAEEQGLFFPRGLYGDDKILFGQIDVLQSRSETFTFDPDMSLLLGYQLIGVERNDEARQWLERAGQFEINEESTVILLDLLDKLEVQPEITSENNL